MKFGVCPRDLEEIQTQFEKNGEIRIPLGADEIVVGV
jgi:hypothetical protein